MNCAWLICHLPHSQAHVAARVAPATVAGASAVGADLHVVDHAGRQAGEGDGAGVGTSHGMLPRADCAVGGDCGDAHSVGLRIFHRFHAQDQAAAAAVHERDDGRSAQLRACAIGAHDFETAGKRRRTIPAAICLHIRSEPAKQRDKGSPCIVLGGSRSGASLCRVGEGACEGIERSLQRGGGDWHSGESGVSPQVFEHGERGFLHARIGCIGKA